MKNKFIAIIAIILVVAVAWISILQTDQPSEARISELTDKIAANIEVKTYKNNISMYQELITLDPENINWYTGLADTYVQMGYYGEYQTMCEQIMKTFPNDRTGYLMMMKDYSAANEHSNVLAMYNAMPQVLKEDGEIKALFEKSEWQYVYKDKSYNGIGPCTSGIYVTEINGLHGYKWKTMDAAIEPVFEQARPFIDSYAAVCREDEWYFIDTAGDRILATKDKIEELSSFSQGLAVAKIDGKYGFVDQNFNKYVFNYEDATNFYYGVAALKQNGKWALINASFELLTGFEFDDVVRDEANICSRNGIIILKKGEDYILYDLNGQVLGNKSYDMVRPFYSEYAAAKKGDKWGFIDRAGNTVIDFVYDDASSFAAGIGAVQQAGYWGCIDANGKVILEYEFDYAQVTADNGVVVLKIGDTYRFIQFIKYS